MLGSNPASSLEKRALYPLASLATVNLSSIHLIFIIRNMSEKGREKQNPIMGKNVPYFLNFWQNCAKSEIMAKIEPVLPRTNSAKLSGVISFPPKVTFRPLAVTANYFRRHYIMNLRQEVI